ncbi:N-Acetyl-D-glucosamine ABC transport system [Rothia aeria]|uniref:N-Acetyl-D-glucosamine ABC transport system n=1 Tax=Rothia aeria TaxID=172042 RepID=A0A2Z5QZG6_9MICC|nr:N-Acetyl-D-glucosamine ABC transport system [Rothia aeria]
MRGAHPHVCGEHIPIDSRSRVVLGSSPRMRGTHANEQPLIICSGLIPTYAGNTSR